MTTYLEEYKGRQEFKHFLHKFINAIPRPISVFPNGDLHSTWLSTLGNAHLKELQREVQKHRFQARKVLTEGSLSKRYENHLNEILEIYTGSSPAKQGKGLRLFPRWSLMFRVESLTRILLFEDSRGGFYDDDYRETYVGPGFIKHLKEGRVFCALPEGKQRFPHDHLRTSRWKYMMFTHHKKVPGVFPIWKVRGRRWTGGTVTGYLIQFEHVTKFAQTLPAAIKKATRITKEHVAKDLGVTL